MRRSDLARLVALGAIWGASFIFMRVAAPALGAALTAALRVSIAGLVLLAWFRVAGPALDWRRQWRHYAAIGAINSALPFYLYSYAALHLPAAYSAILNSTAPLFGALFSAAWLREPVSRMTLAGLALGMSGVVLVVQPAGTAAGPQFAAAVAACLGAAACYAVAGIYVKRRAAHLTPGATTAGSQVMAGAWLLPLLPFSPPPGPVSALVVANVLALALLCSALAYLIYFRLIADAGPTRALTVTFLIPVFGVLWGALFLGEVVGAGTLAGAALIGLGLAATLRPAARG